MHRSTSSSKSEVALPALSRSPSSSSVTEKPRCAKNHQNVGMKRNASAGFLAPPFASRRLHRSSSSSGNVTLSKKETTRKGSVANEKVMPLPIIIRSVKRVESSTSNSGRDKGPSAREHGVRKGEEDKLSLCASEDLEKVAMPRPLKLVLSEVPSAPPSPAHIRHKDVDDASTCASDEVASPRSLAQSLASVTSLVQPSPTPESRSDKAADDVSSCASGDMVTELSPAKLSPRTSESTPESAVCPAADDIEKNEESTDAAPLVIGNLEVNFLNGQQLMLPAHAGKRMGAAKLAIAEYKPISPGFILQLLHPEGIVQDGDAPEKYIGIALTAIYTRLPLSDEARNLMKRMTLFSPEECRIRLIEVRNNLSFDDVQSLVELLSQVQPQRFIWRYRQSDSNQLTAFATALRRDLEVEYLELGGVCKDDMDQVLKVLLRCPALQRCRISSSSGLTPQPKTLLLASLNAEDVSELRSKVKARITID